MPTYGIVSLLRTTLLNLFIGQGMVQQIHTVIVNHVVLVVDIAAQLDIFVLAAGEAHLKGIVHETRRCIVLDAKPRGIVLDAHTQTQVFGQIGVVFIEEYRGNTRSKASQQEVFG